MTLSRLVSTIQQLTKICRKLKTKIFNSLIPTRPQRPWHVSDYTSEFQNINKGQSNLAKGGIARLMTSITVHSLSISSTIFARWQHALRSWPWCQWCVRLGPPFSGKMRSSLTVSMGRAKGLQKMIMVLLDRVDTTFISPTSQSLLQANCYRCISTLYELHVLRDRTWVVTYRTTFLCFVVCSWNRTCSGSKSYIGPKQKIGLLQVVKHRASTTLGHHPRLSIKFRIIQKGV